MKRILDILLSSLGILLLWPLFFLLGCLILANFGRPIFFFQVRPGKDCKPFRLIKFRTMTLKKDLEGNLLPNEFRHTKCGRFLRSTSLDELPSLVNVLKGDMSLVGPRPLKMDYISLYNIEQLRRHEVRPGITGWAQVNGRNAISFTERFKMDVWYVDHQSFLLDLKIMWMTFLKVLKRENISPGEKREMEPFNGFN